MKVRYEPSEAQTRIQTRHREYVFKKKINLSTVLSTAKMELCTLSLKVRTRSQIPSDFEVCTHRAKRSNPPTVVHRKATGGAGGGGGSKREMQGETLQHIRCLVQVVFQSPLALLVYSASQEAYILMYEKMMRHSSCAQSCQHEIQGGNL